MLSTGQDKNVSQNIKTFRQNTVEGTWIGDHSATVAEWSPNIL